MGLSILYVVLSAVLTTVAGSCPQGFHPNGTDYCYAILRVPVAWSEALRVCNAFGAKLAHIESAAEDQFVLSLLTKLKGSIPTKEVWLGGTDMLVEGMWYWADSLERIQYTNWFPGEPNNDSGQHCLALFRDKGFKWDDTSCNEKLLPLCKRPFHTSEIGDLGEIIG